MLLDFKVGNFRSIREPVTLSMERIPRLREKDLDKTNVITVTESKRKLLKSAVMYGANASGKSNVIKALYFMDRFVYKSAKDTQVGEKIQVSPFAFCEESQSAPSMFEIRFLVKGDEYRYSFEVTEKAIASEWLFRNDEKLFTREGEKISCSKLFPEGKDCKKKTRGNSLFLSVCAQWNGEISTLIMEEFFGKLGIVSGVTDEHLFSFSVDKLDDLKSREKIVALMKAAGAGITGVEVAKIPFKKMFSELPAELREELGKLKNIKKLSGESIPALSFYHGSGNRLEYKYESEGTKKFFNLAGPIIEALEKSHVLVIDEFDARLHPMLAREIVRMFNSKSNKESQLVIATHDTNLLSPELFRRDQIWFTEKNDEQETDLYSLAEYKIEGKPIRQDATYEKDYLKGRYGAIPFLGEFSYEEKK